jgi:arsenate reductase (glutaredoxin)
MKIYHNARCSKSRQTLDLIRKAGIEPEIVDYLNDTPSEQELSELVRMLGISPEQLVRKGEDVFKEKFKGRELSDQEWISAMVAHPKLIERPIVVKQKKAVLGRPPENVKALL